MIVVVQRHGGRLFSVPATVRMPASAGAVHRRGVPASGSMCASHRVESCRPRWLPFSAKVEVVGSVRQGDVPAVIVVVPGAVTAADCVNVPATFNASVHSVPFIDVAPSVRLFASATLKVPLAADMSSTSVAKSLLVSVSVTSPAVMLVVPERSWPPTALMRPRRSGQCTAGAVHRRGAQRQAVRIRDVERAVCPADMFSAKVAKSLVASVRVTVPAVMRGGAGAGPPPTASMCPPTFNASVLPCRSSPRPASG